MKEKIVIEICAGTACFVMGGSDLLTVDEYLTESEKQKLSVIPTTCQEYCQKQEGARPPFVTINGRLFDRMSMDRLLSTIRTIGES